MPLRQTGTRRTERARQTIMNFRTGRNWQKNKDVAGKSFNKQQEGFAGKALNRKAKTFGAPGEIRTPGLLLRRQSLYPAELRARKRLAYSDYHFRAAHSSRQSVFC